MSGSRVPAPQARGMTLEAKTAYKDQDQECKPRKYPGLLQKKPCFTGNNTIQHGKTGDTGSSRCLGAYCWYGHLVPIPCPFAKPKDEKFNYTRRNATWPNCCYFTRTCK
ncbi:uncharacterized protein LOC119179777 isoform X2 [Rhipicephalus microplus]|uniref:uncharacterized protein LOC119179777 isoform X2 n=1 Tax=Rhipicephalus microplus TaxID=6941 RepID=UPI003F6BD23B